MCHVCGFICYLCVELKLMINTRSLSNQALKSAHPSLLSSRCWPWGVLVLVSRYSTVRSGTLTWREWGLWSCPYYLHIFTVATQIQSFATHARHVGNSACRVHDHISVEDDWRIKKQVAWCKLLFTEGLVDMRLICGHLKEIVAPMVVSSLVTLTLPVGTHSLSSASG